MTDKKQPKLILICGPNGAGKTTFTQKAALANTAPIVDPDKIAKDRGLDSLAAGRIALDEIKSYLDSKQSFIKESTLTSNSDFNLIKKAKEKGFHVSMVYVGLDSKEMSQDRVNLRHATGGHDIPAEDIARRFDKSVGNLFKAIQTADLVKVYDNSKFQHTSVATFEKGQLAKGFCKERDEQSPKWFTDGYAKSQ